jgi:hypothetical protein
MSFGWLRMGNPGQILSANEHGKSDSSVLAKNFTITSIVNPQKTPTFAPEFKK